MPRTKGATNKKRDLLHEKCQELKVDPFEILLLFAKGDWKKLGYKSETTIKYFGESSNEEYVISPELRANCAEKACAYLHAKRKAVEHAVAPEAVTHITRTVLTKEVKQGDS